MGSGGLRARRKVAPEPEKGSTRTAEAPPASSPQLQARLAPILQLAAKVRAAGGAEFERALEHLAVAPAIEVRNWFADWSARASPKARSSLLELLRRAVGHVLHPHLAATEGALSSANTEGVDVGQLAEVCEEKIRLEDAVHRDGLKAAVVVLGYAAASKAAAPEDCALSTFDRIVQIFHRAFVAQVASAPRNFNRWKEMEAETGLPPIEEYPQLLGTTAKGALLSLQLVPEGTAPLPVVVSRDAVLADAGPQLPGKHACVLSPYFESKVGAKVVQGRRVEGGEGHGPRKEFFAIASTDSLRKWGPATAAPVRPQAGSGSKPAGAFCKGNRVTLAEADALAGASAAGEVRKCLQNVKPGDNLRLELLEGKQAELTVTGWLGSTALVLSNSVGGKADLEAVEVLRCEVRKPVKPLFEFHRGTGQQWFGAHANELEGPRAEELRQRYCTFGKLLALAITNHSKLSFVLPLMFFRMLMAGEEHRRALSLEDLKGFDDVLHASLRKCLKMKQAQFKSLVELEGLPEKCTREEYVAEQVRSSIWPAAMDEIRRGFWALVPEDRMRFVSPGDVQHWVCPVSLQGKDMNLRQIFHIVMEDEMQECKPLAEAFLSTLDALSLAERKQFLLFVTGVEAPPEPGTEQLTVSLPFSAFSREEHVAMLGMLPQAHTCSNTLELPNYYEALVESGQLAEEDNHKGAVKELQRLLGERLRTAISESTGYDLDAMAGEAAADEDASGAVGSSMVSSTASTGTSNHAQPAPPEPSVAVAAVAERKSSGRIGLPVPAERPPAAAEVRPGSQEGGGEAAALAQAAKDATSMRERMRDPQVTSSSLASLHPAPEPPRGDQAWAATAATAGGGGGGGETRQSTGQSSRQGSKLSRQGSKAVDLDCVVESLEASIEGPLSEVDLHGAQKKKKKKKKEVEGNEDADPDIHTPRKRQDVDMLLEELDFAIGQGVAS